MNSAHRICAAQSRWRKLMAILIARRTKWFVNLADNSGNLDANNGGFTVFGTVLGDGMAVLDAIDALPFVSPRRKGTQRALFLRILR